MYESSDSVLYLELALEYNLYQTPLADQVLTKK